MSFVNTVDVIGDEVLSASIIDRSITEIADNISTSIGVNVFRNCKALTTADFPSVTSIGVNAFFMCTALSRLILRSETMCSMANDAIDDSGIDKRTGYIYVPAALVDSYKTATNWSKYANQFRVLEDYTVDGTITGELDPTKI